jgi:hypothetical protein
MRALLALAVVVAVLSVVEGVAGEQKATPGPSVPGHSSSPISIATAT